MSKLSNTWILIFIWCKSNQSSLLWKRQSVTECHTQPRAAETLNSISSRWSNVNTHLLIWKSLNLYHIVMLCNTQTLTMQKTCKTEAEFWNWDLRCFEMWLKFSQRVCTRMFSSQEDADLKPGFNIVNPKTIHCLWHFNSHQYSTRVIQKYQKNELGETLHIWADCQKVVPCQKVGTW